MTWRSVSGKEQWARVPMPLTPFHGPSFSQRDDVRCVVSATFGPGNWPIPATEISYPSGPDRIKIFAKAFLEGRVCRHRRAALPQGCASGWRRGGQPALSSPAWMHCFFRVPLAGLFKA